MADENPVGQNQGVPVKIFADHDPLFRVLTKPKWLQKENLDEAFFLRPTEVGLSVNYDCDITQAQRFANLDSIGVAKIFHGSVCEVPVSNAPEAERLTVKADDSHHAEIMGLPQHAANAAEANRIAIALAERCVEFHQQKFRKV